MNKIPERCPVCENDLIVTRVYCDQCGTTLSGSFGLTISPLNRLNQEQMDFLLTFIRCEGKFNRMEEELGLSYPTVKNRFNEILEAIGFEKDADKESQSLSSKEKMTILRKLNEGKISPEEAEQLLLARG